MSCVFLWGGGAAEDTAKGMKDESSGSDQGKVAQEEKMPTEESSIDKARSDIDTLAQEGLSVEEAALRKAILRKLKELASGIDREQDLDKLRKQFDCIEAALKALRSMER